MIFEWKVALRFLKEGKGQTLFILLGISVGAGVMIFLNILIAGLQTDLINGTIGNSPHIWITGDNMFENNNIDSNTEYIKGNFVKNDTNLMQWDVIEEILLKNENLSGVSTVAEGNGFVKKGGKNNPVLLRGVTLQKADSIYDISSNIISGNAELSGNKVIIGKNLAVDNEIKVNNIINIELPDKTGQSFVVSGIFDLGNSSTNSSWIFMDISRSQKLLDLGNNISKIEIQIDDVFQAEEIAASINNRFDNIKAENWIVSNASLLTALESQSYSSYMIQIFVLLAVTLGIASVLAVSVVQKSKQLGILKAMGTKRKSASRIFLFQGLALGTLGSILGAVLGILLVKGFLWGTSLETGTPIFQLEIQYKNIFIISLITIVSSTIAAFVPAKKSSKLNPVEVIRNG